MKTTMVTPYIFAPMVIILAANAGLAESLGAHPFWSISIAWLGVPFGLIVALATKWLDWSWLLRVSIGIVGLGIAYAVATYGKSAFAASYAEDVLAGRMWYFGWVGVAIFATVLVAALFSPTRVTPDA
jgi:hypothetical protein